ncbi:PEX11 domain protein [Fonsecaea pedrosoi]|nr:PEX11 domain protein [Fonsecaea pedrosoi]
MLKVGVEKSLKFLQSTSQIAATVGYLSPDEAALWLTAKDQFALARRFLRLFKWIDCWNTAYAQYQSFPASKATKDQPTKPSQPTIAQSSVHSLLIVSKWSLLGMYLFIEMFTIVDAVLGTWRPWAVTAQIEALKFWFYALSASVALSLYELLFVYPDPASSKNNNNQSANEKKEKTTSTVVEKTSRKGGAVDESSEPEQTKPRNPPTAKRNAIFRQLVIDTCDLLIPAAAVGWFPLDPVTVGAAGSVSALLGGSDVWYRVNA